jgi:hypothetical protein
MIIFCILIQTQTRRDNGSEQGSFQEKKTNLKYNCEIRFLMYPVASLAGIFILALGSMMFGALFNGNEQAQGQVNMTNTTGENMTETPYINMTGTTGAAPPPQVLMQKLNNALDDGLGKVRQQDPDAHLSKVNCTIDTSWNVQCTITWLPGAKEGQVAGSLNSSKSNRY